MLRDGKPFLALSSPGGDSQDQQALQVLLNIAVFNMRPQEAIEAPRFNSLHYQESFGRHRVLRGRCRSKTASLPVSWRPCAGWGTAWLSWARS